LSARTVSPFARGCWEKKVSEEIQKIFSRETKNTPRERVAEKKKKLLVTMHTRNKRRDDDIKLLYKET
jgi:flagellar biosynthesis/type III secretory pathway chaperone